ncbi:hypothetical protein ES703_115578 [subsurface metagenome]
MSSPSSPSRGLKMGELCLSESVADEAKAEAVNEADMRLVR